MNSGLRILRGVSARLPKRRIIAIVLPVLVLALGISVSTGAWGAAWLSGGLLVLLCGMVGVQLVRRRRRQRASELADLEEKLVPRTVRPALDESEYAKVVRRSAWALLRLGARYRSSRALELLAIRATRGESGWTRLQDLLLDPNFDELPEPWWVEEVLGASYLACMLETSHRNIETARRAVHLALDSGETTAFEEEARLSWALQIAVSARDRELVERLAVFEPVYPAALWAARVDLLRPSVLDARIPDGFPQEGPQPRSAVLDPWWGAFNALFRSSQIEEWELDGMTTENRHDLFSHIRAPRVRAADTSRYDGATVSVIVPTYNPSRVFLNTIESLVRQSWSKIEILIIDDASTEGLAYIDAAVASDKRVRRVTLAENGGAYRARNVGLREATGDFVMVLDSDDLAHPRRIELQLEPFFEPSDSDREVIASVSRAVRVMSDGRVTVMGFTPERMNTSSLMFQRDRVIERMGYYDEVYKAGDTEFMDRMMVAFPMSRIARVPQHLGLTQLTPGSLSRSDFRPGNWHSGDRVAYRNQFRGWHAALAQAEEATDPRLEPGEMRCFHAPASLRRTPQPERFGIAVLAAWEAKVEQQNDSAGAVAEIAKHVDGPIGLLNGANPRHSTHRHDPVGEATWRLVESGNAEWMSWSAETRVGTLIVTDPELTILLPDVSEIGVRPERIVLVAESMITLPDRGMAGIDAEWVHRECLRAFGTQPEWVTGTPELLRACSGTEALEATLVRCPGAIASSAASNEARRTRVAVLNSGLSAKSREHWNWIRRQMPDGIAVDMLVEPNDGTAAELIARSDLVIVDPLDVRSITRHDLVWRALRNGVIVLAPARYGLAHGETVVIVEPESLADAIARFSTPTARSAHLERAMSRIALTNLAPMIAENQHRSPLADLP